MDEMVIVTHVGSFIFVLDYHVGTYSGDQRDYSLFYYFLDILTWDQGCQELYQL